MAGHYFETVENNITGKPVANATILVYSAGATVVGDAITAGTLATVFSDDGVTQIDQSESPITTNSRGFFEFWTNETSVCYEISYDGEAKFAVSDVEIIGGSIGGDVTAIAVRVSALEALSDDYLEIANNLSDVASASTARTNLGLGTIATQAASNVSITGGSVTGITDLAVADGGTGASSASAARSNLLVNVITPVFNFSDDGECRFYAETAMTLTEQGTSGTGSVAYEKSTAAAPSTFSSTSSPVSLEAGAWLKVTASSVSSIYAVALKRTA